MITDQAVQQDMHERQTSNPGFQAMIGHIHRM